jgi:hypothetical protein
MPKSLLTLYFLISVLILGCAENVSAPSPDTIPPEPTLPPANEQQTDTVIEFAENPDSLPLLESL